MPDLMMGLRRQQSRHPRLGDRGTYIASHIGPRQGYRINHRVTADENTPTHVDVGCATTAASFADSPEIDLVVYR